jgi:hypothetical protein
MEYMAMIEWIQHWDQMRFYYGGMSGLILWPLYLAQLVAIGALWWVFSKFNAKLWVPLAATALLLPVAAIWPWWEELGIAYNFGQLCKKDAGIFIHKTVEVEGYFDATRAARADPVPKEVAESFDRQGYRFYEAVLPDFRGGRNRVVRFEKVDGVWTPTVLDHSTARYHYRWPDMNRIVSHKIERTERSVVDVKSGDTLGRYVDYGRRAPWFFVALDAPLMFCKEAAEDARARGTLFGAGMILQPKH